MNIILVGLGPHAKRIYVNFLKKYNIEPKLIVDLESKKQKLEKILEDNDWEKVPLYLVPDNERDNIELSEKVRNDLSKFIKENNVTHGIISTEPKSHFSYAMLLLKNNINILMDKPITSPKDVINDPKQAEKIKKEYEMLCEEYRKQKLINPNLVFSIQCQRRFHKGYKYIKNILEDVIKKYNVPITYIDIYHNDGMWNMPDEFIFRENHPYKYGYGKLFHSGYHFIDLLTWLLDVNSNLKGKKINNCSIYAEPYRPNDFVYNFNKEDYNKILKTNKFDKVLTGKNVYDNYGEIDVHSIINFYNDDKLVTNCTLNLMQSGFSRRSWADLPEDTYKSNGRVRHERLNIEVGPLLNIQVHSYQAYEVKDRKKYSGDSVGNIEHFDIYIFRNKDLIGGEVFEVKKLSQLENKIEEGKFIGYNERARERCFLDFINNIQNDSDILLHKQSIILTKELYKSMIYGGRKMEFDFNLEKENLIGKVTDKDLGLEIVKNTKIPVIRKSARGIILNKDGKIAVINKKNKNEYKLPGGGLEEGESPKLTFARECEEELACKVKVDKKLGVIIEDKSKENFKQLSHVFIGNKLDDLKNTNLTLQEEEEGLQCVWVSKEEALKLLKESLKNLKGSKYDNLYRTKFVVIRDIKILEYYIKNI